VYLLSDVLVIVDIHCFDMVDGKDVSLICRIPDLAYSYLVPVGWLLCVALPLLNLHIPWDTPKLFVLF